MTNPTNPPAQHDSQFSLADAPGGDLNWDELFPPEQGVPAPTTVQQGTQEAPTAPAPEGQPPAQPTATPPTQDFFLRTKSTVYKTAEDAAQGVEHKDAIIEQLRQRYILERGVDPITNQPVQRAPEQPVSYTQDRNRYFRDLVEAAQKNDPERYFEAQQKLVLDILAPYAPSMSQLARNQALESVAAEIKDFREFSGGEGYKKVLEETPVLRQAIEQAEQNPAYQGQLTELYRLAYWTAQGRRLPELLKAQQQPSQPAAAVRPTAQPSSIPPSSTPSGSAPDMSTSEGRKAIMKDMESRGIDKMAWQGVL